MEINKESGLSFEGAVEDLDKKLATPGQPRKQRVEPDNQSSLAMLNSMVGRSNFEGGQR